LSTEQGADELVSIVIPAHNAAQFICQTLDSALRQTWPALEIVVVDDGSTDRTAELAQRYSARGVHVLRQLNHGAAAARNRGFAASHGKYIQYLDADDLLSPEKIAVQVRALRGTRCHLASCRWATFKTEPDDGQMQAGALFRDLAPADYFKTLFSLEGSGFLPCHAWLTPRSLIQEVGPWNVFLAGADDGEFFCRIMASASGVTFCDSGVAFYRRVTGSLSSPKDALDVAQMIAGLDCMVAHASRVIDVATVATGVARAYGAILVGQWPASRPFEVRLLRRIALYSSEPYVPAIGGSGAEALKRIVGWKTARRLQRRFRSLKSAVRVRRD
jgi:glycosyltransferase involved in cell wall biosynthesis